MDPLAGHPRYASIRTLEQHGRSVTQLALDRASGELVSIKLTARGAPLLLVRDQPGRCLSDWPHTAGCLRTNGARTATCGNHPRRAAAHPTCAGWDESQSKQLLRELLIHQELSACGHPHITELRDAFLTPSHLAAVREHVEGEDLQAFLANTGGRCVACAACAGH
jgi:serine/threonine protein kinase